MAELPEIETLRHDLEREFGGKRIKSVELTSMKAFARHQNRKQVTGRLEGAKVANVRRLGLLLIFKLDNDELLVIDAANGGYLSRNPAKDPVEPHTQAVITFTQGPQLRAVDPSDGDLQMFVVAADQLAEEVPETAELGLDSVASPISWLSFADLVRRNKIKLKTLLTDPTILVGIGPVYSDEILWDAGLRADRYSDELSTQEMRRLNRSVVEIMHDAIKHRGTTLADGLWRDLAGKPGGYQEFINAYQRDGEACRRCRGTITKRKFGNRYTWNCEDCQV